MRWGYRALALVTAATLVVAGCSDDDDSAADAASERSSSTTSSTTTTTTTTSTTVAAVDTGSGTTARTTASTRRAATATTKPPPPTTTTTIPPCNRTAGSGATFDLGGEGPATVVLRNSHTASVVITLRGAAYTLGPGGSQEVTVDPGVGAESVTAAPASDPGKRYALSIHLRPKASHDLTARTITSGEACAGRVELALTGFNGHS